jgi:uracil-DNA glycosylase family 4
VEEKCTLFGTKPVDGDGPLPASIMLIGELPGETEHYTGRPFQGRAGQELNNYLSRSGLRRSCCYVTNLIKCHTLKNRKPKNIEINLCAPYLVEEIIRCNPIVIGSLGAFSTKFLLGDVSLEYVHGIPYEIDRLPSGIEIPRVIVVPCYHPAFGLRKTEMMSHTMMDFQALAKVFNREIGPREPSPPVERDYKLITDPNEIEEMPEVAIDTESVNFRIPGNPSTGSMWCITYSTAPNMSRMVMAEDKRCIRRFAEWVKDPSVICDIHNAPYDLPVLKSANVTPATVVDTMTMAYLLQTEPKGLKPLAYRHLNVDMKEYDDVVGVASTDNALVYLLGVLEKEWPDPEPVIKWEKDKVKIKQPSNIQKRVEKILSDYDKRGDKVNLYKRWKNIKLDEGRGEVEEDLGPMPPGYLSDIPFEDAFEYAARDADVTFQIKPILWKKIVDMGLEDTFWRDMRAMPMVSEMRMNGMKINKEYLSELSVNLGDRLDMINGSIDYIIRGHLNPASPKQVLELLLKCNIFKKGDKVTTDAKHLKKHRKQHILVDKILNWRELSKIKGTYADSLPKKVDSESRIHSNIGMTTTLTGRLVSTNPNLLNIPVKTRDGLMVRAGFIPESGCVFLSNDYSQIELRILAHMSQDKNMMDAFWNNEDLHAKTAKRVYELNGGCWERLSPEMKRHKRLLIKPINFGIAYGLTASGLFYDLTSQGIDVTIEDCVKFIDNWFDLYPDVYIWLDEIKAEAKRKGMIRDLFGRMRLCPEGWAADKWIKLAGERQAINTPIQSGAAGVTKEAMGQLVSQGVYYDLTEGGKYICRPVLQIHDDIMFEVSEEIYEVSALVINSVMTNAAELSVPIKVDSKYGYNWRDMSKIEI